MRGKTGMKKDKIKKYYLYCPTHPVKRTIGFLFWTLLYLFLAIMLFFFKVYDGNGVSADPYMSKFGGYDIAVVWG